MIVTIEVSVGELLDKISILEIKSLRIKQEEKLKNIRKELESLTLVRDAQIRSEDIEDLYGQLKTINESLWDIEDRIRLCEKRKDFSQEFIQLARMVYLENDQRSKVKSEINNKLGSVLREEKSYSEYSFQ